MTLSVHNLSCERMESRLFCDLSFQLSPQQILHVRGPNGSGKTTLLKVISGLLRPSGGAVYWQGVPIHRDWETYHNALLYVGHKPGLKSRLTPVENLRFMMGMREVIDETVIVDALIKLGLQALCHEPIEHLSAGQQRRVALASLLLSNTSFWILDEPFTAMDKEGISLLETLLAKHLQQGGMIMLTSHQQLKLGSVAICHLDLA